MRVLAFTCMHLIYSFHMLRKSPGFTAAARALMRAAFTLLLNARMFSEQRCSQECEHCTLWACATRRLSGFQRIRDAPILL